MIKKFADNTKLRKNVKNEQDRVAFQQGVESLHRWSAEWQMPFNEDKCHVLHVGRTNARPHLEYAVAAWSRWGTRIYWRQFKEGQS